MDQSAVEYYRLREREERAAAAASTDPLVADVHLEMAERYADRAWAETENMHQPGPVPMASAA